MDSKQFGDAEEKHSIKLILLLLAVGVYTKLSLACQVEWQGKPLLHQQKINHPQQIFQIDQPELELTYIIFEQGQQVVDTPNPAGIPEVIGFLNPQQDIAATLCIYPTYQHNVEAFSLASKLNISSLSSSEINKKLAYANLLWGKASRQSKKDAAKIYYELFLALENENSKDKQHIWISALYASYTLFNLGRTVDLLDTVDVSNFDHKIQVKAGFIRAKIALYDKKIADAIAILTNIERNDTSYTLSLNEKIELHLLLSNAYFDNNKLAAGKRSLEHINQILGEKDHIQFASNHLLANYYDNRGHFFLSKFYQQDSNSFTELQNAIELEYKGLAVAHLSGVHDQQISIHSNIAWIHKSAFRFESAIRNYRIALALLEGKNDRMNEALVYRNLGITYLSLGAYKTSISYLRKVLQITQENTPVWAARTRCLIGNVQREMGQYSDAVDSHKQCVDKLKQLNITSDDLTISQIELAQSLAKIGDTAAESNLSKLLAIKLDEIQNPDVRVQSRLWLANFYSNTGNVSAASELYDQAIRYSLRAANSTLRVHAPMQAALASIRHRVTANNDYINLAIENIERVSTQLQAGELGPDWSNRINSFYQTIISHYLNSDAEEQAFDLYERSRAISLRKLKAASYPVEPIDAHNNLRLTRISELAANIAGSKSVNDDFLNIAIERNILALDKGKSDTNHVLAELNWYAKNKDAHFQQSEELQKPLSLRQIQSNLNSEQAALAYFESSNRLFLFIVGSNHFSVHDLEDIDIVNKLTLDASEVISEPDSHYRPKLRSLAKSILPDLAFQLGVKHFYIIPTGNLNKVPFSALPIHTTKLPLNMMVHDYQLTKTPSFTSLWQDKKENNGPHTYDFVMFGDPKINRSNIPSENKNIFPVKKRTWADDLPRLAWTQKEAASLKKMFSDQTAHFYMQHHANRSNFLKTSVRNAKILHIATHSFYDQEQPDNVGFTLSRVDHNGKNDPGFVSISELSIYPFKNQLVVINGCASAMGEMSKGEGLQGMARSFLVSGASNVIATLWPISDKSSADFIVNFYAHLKGSNNYGLALQKTQIAYANDYVHPYYWAAYSLYTTKKTANL